MKKKMRFLALLVMSLILCSFSTNVEAAVPESITPDIEKDEYWVYDNGGYILDENRLSSVFEITKEEYREGRLIKIIIPEYSYVTFQRINTTYLYEDKDMNELIGKDIIEIFLPKGEYYLYIKDENCVDLTDGKNYLGVLSRRPISDAVMARHCSFATASHCSIAGVWDFTDWIYGIKQDYPNIKECYAKVTYTIKGKTGSEYPSFIGDTKKILDIEKKGGTYDLSKSESINSSSSSSKKKDTKKPTVKGIGNNKTYKKSVKFKVSDASGIKKVTLNKKKISVSKAKKGYTVKKKGKYTLKVWDKAGNVRTVKFKIKK